MARMGRQGRLPDAVQAALMKSKSLKGGNWAGLIGFRKLQKHASLWPKLLIKAEPPAGFNPQFLTMQGGR